MSSTPLVWKVYVGAEIRGAARYAEDAAAQVAAYGPGASVRDVHNRTVWREGEDGTAADSYDAAAEHMREASEAIRTELRMGRSRRYGRRARQ